MSGPRQVARIAHKARRLLTRDGYGTRSTRRSRPRDVDAAYFCPSCLKVAYRRAAAAEAMRDAMAVDDPRADQLNVYDCPVVPGRAVVCRCRPLRDSLSRLEKDLRGTAEMVALTLLLTFGILFVVVAVLFGWRP